MTEYEQNFRMAAGERKVLRYVTPGDLAGASAVRWLLAGEQMGTATIVNNEVAEVLLVPGDTQAHKGRRLEAELWANYGAPEDESRLAHGTVVFD